jgi:capsular exopolysaccharide synthesis family protein
MTEHNQGRSGGEDHATPAQGQGAQAALPQQPVVMPMASSPPVPAAGLNFWQLVGALRQRWLLAVCASLPTAAIITATTWFILPLLLPAPKHLVHSQLHVSPNPQTVLFANAEYRTDFQASQQTQVALVKSRLVLNKALRDPRVAKLGLIVEQPDPVDWLEKEIKADFTLSPEILRISISGDNPTELTVLVNAITNAYLEEIVNKEHNKRLARLDQLKAIHSKIEDGMRNKREALKQLAVAVGGGDKDVLAAQEKAAIEQFGAVEREIQQNRSDLRKWQNELHLLQPKEKTLDKVPVPESLVDEIIDKDPIITQLTLEKTRLENEAEATMNRAVRGENEPRVKALRIQIKEIKDSLAERRKKVRPIVLEQTRIRLGGDLKTRVATLEERIALAKELDKVLTDELKVLQTRSKGRREESWDLQQLKQDIDQQDSFAKKASEQAATLELEIQAPPRTRLLQEAVAVSAPENKRNVLITSAVGCGVLALTLFGVGWWQLRAKRINAAEDVVQGLGMHLVGTLPALVEQPRRQLFFSRPVSSHYWQSMLTESVDAARTMILHAAKTRSLRVLMITSATGGEGKTSLSSHMAISLVRAGLKTLFVDCDLRSPNAHRLFNLNLEPGFCDVLKQEAKREDVIQATAVAGLDLIAAGQRDERVGLALAQGQARAFFEELKQLYDFIVVDSAPVLPVVDSLLLAQQIDAVLFSILREVSRRPMVAAACEQLTRLGVPILGAVVNGVEADSYTSGRYSYARESEDEG